MKNGELSRREFMRDGAVAAAGLAAGLAAGGSQGARAGDEAAAKKTRSYNPNMEYRRLGKTGLWVSAVCLGGHWKRVDKVIKLKGRVGGIDIPKGKGLRSAFHQNRWDVVGRCIDAGINYIDACSGGEVMAYAKALKGRREKVYLGYSWHVKEMRFAEWRTAGKLLQGLEEGLREAGLEYVDLWRISMLTQGSRHKQTEVEETAAALEKARKQGKCRFTGVSSHDRPWLKTLIEKYPEQIQVVLSPYTARSKVLPKDSLFEAVKKCDVGVFGIKPFASNSLFKGTSAPDDPNAEEDDRRARLAIRYILCNRAVTAPIPGLISIHQVDNMAKAVKERRRLDLTEKAELQKAADEMWAKLPEDYQWLKEWEYV